MPQSFASLDVHVVFSTKHRAMQIDQTLAGDLYPYLGGILSNCEGALLHAGGMPDHVHLLCSFGRRRAIADVVRTLKANSSKWIHGKFPKRRDFAWQAGYGAFSVSFSQRKVVKQYIDNQIEHHRKRSFQQEFRTLLRKHKIEWDEEYVWD